MTILDCTLRDGGYYTKWDFEKSIVDQYIAALNDLPVDYIELGYRSPLKFEYHGKYFYLPLYELSDLKAKSNKKFAVILNEKDIGLENLPAVLEGLMGIIDLVRLAVKPENLERAITLAEKVKSYGFKVSFNLMYLSDWKGDTSFIHSLEKLNGIVDIFYLVDSYGGLFPEDLRKVIPILQSKLSCKLGFHGHNNIETALINAMTAIAAGVDFIDATILGMGRGAGNLKTELLLTVLHQRKITEVNFSSLEKAVSAFQPLMERYGWGTNLPYMISGINSLPQKRVIEQTTVRYYSLDTIVKNIEVKERTLKEDWNFEPIEISPCPEVLIIGGGGSIHKNQRGIQAFLKEHSEISLIHASSKNAKYFEELDNPQFFCLVGSEAHRLEETLQDLTGFDKTCVVSPFSNRLETYIPADLEKNVKVLKDISFTDRYLDAHTSIALQLAINLNPTKIWFVGYDGYPPEEITDKERKLILENEYLFKRLERYVDKIASLTETYYFLPAYENLFYILSK